MRSIIKKIQINANVKIVPQYGKLTFYVTLTIIFNIRVISLILTKSLSQLKIKNKNFSQGTPLNFTNKTYLHDITEILLKVTLNTINITPNPK